MKKRKLIEWGKTLLIVLLLASAALLSVRSGYFSSAMERAGLSSGGSSGGEETAAAGTAEATRGTWPLAIAVCGSDGRRCGAAYDEDAVEALYQRFSAALGEALGSAGEPRETGESEFRRCLQTQGLFIRLHCAYPLGLLADRLGVEMSGTAAGDSAALLYLSTEGGSTVLYYRGAEGKFYACSTAVNAAALGGRLEEQEPNGAVFAFEREDLAGLDGYTLLLEQLPDVYRAESANPLRNGEETSELLQALDMNAYVASRYVESDGTSVYVDGDMTLRIAASGSVLFRRSGGEGLAAPDGSLESAVELAWSIAAGTVGKYSGAARVGLSGVTVREDGYTVTFAYYLNGIPVRLASGNAAEIVITDGQVVRAELELRSFTLTEETETLLPMALAGAIAAESGGGELSLCYADRGGTVDCIWVN